MSWEGRRGKKAETKAEGKHRKLGKYVDIALDAAPSFLP
jgi:hypothetical protein